MARQRLIDRLENEFGVDRSETRLILNPELIQLKDAKKRLLDFGDTDETIGMRSVLNAYNALIGEHVVSPNISQSALDVLLKGKLLGFSRTTYHRVFNNSSFEQGGRFYGPWWINAPGSVRRHILIDGMPTVELDYSAMHIHLVYSLEGIDYWSLHGPEDDPYTIDGESPEMRNAIKKAFIIALNCTSKKKAIYSITNEFRELGYDTRTLVPRKVVAAFEQRHPRIAHHLYSGSGTHLQRLESNITEEILIRTLERNECALNIHDGFILKLDGLEQLKNDMIDSFHFWKLTSVPNISIEY